LDVNTLLEKAEQKFEGIHSTIAQKARQLIKMAHTEGIFIIITQGIRTIKEQDALFEHGRTLPGKIVTNARGGYSYHNFGLAFDFCVCDIVAGKLIPNWYVDKRWKRVGEIGKSLGLEWGGDWTSFIDYPHFQLTFDLSLDQLRNGIKPSIENSTETKYRLITGTFNNKQEAEKAADILKTIFGWLVYIKEA
jgi:peptidoglycan LD-endopeptidase CwlK